MEGLPATKQVYRPKDKMGVLYETLGQAVSRYDTRQELPLYLATDAMPLLYESVTVVCNRRERDAYHRLYGGTLRQVY